jgi:hypothetical protein
MKRASAKQSVDIIALLNELPADALILDAPALSD